MSDEEEHESRCGESLPVCALNPQRSTATSAQYSFALAIRVQRGARGADLICGSAASLPPCHENETLRSRQNQRSASVNLPNISRRHSDFLIGGDNLSRATDWKKKSGEISS
jgi:hypothetical protein